MLPVVASHIQKREYDEIINLWIKGVEINWDLLYISYNNHPQRISLPTYPFDRKRYWVPYSAFSNFTPSPKYRDKTSSMQPFEPFHPLLHQKSNDPAGLIYSTTLTGKEFFLTDHQILGEKVLPGVVYLEMARAAAAKVIGFIRKPFMSEKCNMGQACDCEKYSCTIEYSAYPLWKQ